MENAKILIVDDEPGTRDLFQFLLERRKYTVITAANRVEGMDKIRTEKPDLVILDIVMSSWLDGLDMSKRLKKDPEFKDMPVLILTGIREKTGFDFRPDADGPHWCWADSYLEKPVEPDTLLAEVDRLLANKA